MRGFALFIVGGCGLGMTTIAPAGAVGTDYPFCIQGEQYPGLSNCTFTSYQQCQATASGTPNHCISNPYYNASGNSGERPGQYPARLGYPY